MTRIFHTAGLVWLGTALLALGLGWRPMVCTLFGVAAVALLLILLRKLPGHAAVCLGAFGACLLSVAAYQALFLMPSKAFYGTVQTVFAIVEDAEDRGNYSLLTLHTSNKLPQGLGNVKIRVVAFDGLEADTGDVVNCVLELDEDAAGQKERNSRNIRFSGRLLNLQKMGTADTPVIRLVHVREAMRRSITRNLTGEEGQVLSAMLFGRTEQLSMELRRVYARAGTAHLLAVSGLHLAMLAAILSLLLNLFRISPRRRGFAVIIAVFLFMALAGFSYSVTRAGIMLLLLTAAQLFGRDADARNSLGLALILILLQNPYAVFSTSLLLSYLATLGIAAFAVPFSEGISRFFWKLPLEELRGRSCWRYALLSGLSVSICANLLTLPVVCSTFGFVSLVSPLTNLLVACLIPFALASGMLCGLSGLLPGGRLIGRAIALPGGLAVKGVNAVCRRVSALRFAALQVTDRYLLLWIVIVLLVAILLWRQRAESTVKRYAVCLAAVSLLAGALSHSAVSSGAVWMSADEYGNSLAIAYGKQGALIGAPKSVRAAQNIADFLTDHGVETISLLVTEKDGQLDQDSALFLARMFPVETAFSLEETYGFSATLFGNVTVSAEGRNAKSVRMKIGGVTVVKEFEQLALPAHLLVNAHNELVADPRLCVAIDDRYYSSSVFAVELPENRRNG